MIDFGGKTYMMDTFTKNIKPLKSWIASYIIDYEPEEVVKKLSDLQEVRQNIDGKWEAI